MRERLCGKASKQVLGIKFSDIGNQFSHWFVENQFRDYMILRPFNPQGAGNDVCRFGRARIRACSECFHRVACQREGTY